MGSKKSAIGTARRVVAKEIPYFSRYILVGVLNTVLGYGIIFGLMACSFNPYLSNALGYMIGISFSYVLNKRFSFRSSAPDRIAFPLFLASLGTAYLANLAVLFSLLKFLAVNPYVAQIVAGGVYTLVGFLGSRYLAFTALQSRS
ncbi:MAG: GtrA family protein [Desulfosoma sp.]